MILRIADKMNFNQVTRNLNENRNSMSDLQNQAATGKKLLKPSDDPVAAAKILSARTNLAGNEQLLKNNQEAKNFLVFTDQALSELTDIFIRAKELALAQANDPTASPSTMGMVAREVEQLFHDAVSTGNRRFGDRYIFGGFQTIKEPFDNGGNYFGDNGDILMEVSKGQYIAMNVPGSKAFLGDEYQNEPLHGKRALDIKPVETYDGNTKGDGPMLRGPASLQHLESKTVERNENRFARGINALQALKSLQISLEAGDKRGVQQSLDELDIAREQVVTVRSQMGSRLSAVEKNVESLEKMKLDNRIIVSQHEDADAFKTYSDLKRTEGQLQATLQTSGKLIQPSLLDFLR